MKILLLSNMYPSASHVFYGIFVENFSNSMKEHGAEIEKVIIRGRGKSTKEKIHKYISYYWNAIRKITSNNYDAIYVHSASLALIPVTILKPIIKKPVIINIHGGDIMDSGIINNAIFRLNKKTIEGADLLVIPSHAFQEAASKKLKLPKTFVSPSGGINRVTFHPTQTPTKKATSAHTTLGYISRIDQNKGWDTFIEAVSIVKSSHPDIQLNANIVGTGSQVDEMKEMIYRLGLNETISHTPQLPQTELTRIYQTFDAFIFPSRRESESLGLVGLEAMSCGIPVIASKIGGIKDYLNDGVNGFFFQPGNATDLAEKISHFLALPKPQVEILSTGAIATAERYDSKITAKNLYIEIKSICKPLA